MKEREKQIEEMAKADKDLIQLCKLLFENWDGTVINAAKTVLEHYQPKIPEDSVVLSREEIDSAEYFYVQDGELKLIEKGRGKFITNEWYKELLMKMPLGHELAKERKETAEKFIKECKKYKVKKFSPVDIYQRDTGVSWIEMPEWKLDEFVKQFGVEIKEN